MQQKGRSPKEEMYEGSGRFRAGGPVTAKFKRYFGASARVHRAGKLSFCFRWRRVRCEVVDEFVSVARSVCSRVASRSRASSGWPARTPAVCVCVCVFDARTPPFFGCSSRNSARPRHTKEYVSNEQQREARTETTREKERERERQKERKRKREKERGNE